MRAQLAIVCTLIDHIKVLFVPFLYVNDILLAGNDKMTIDEIKQWLFLNFEVKDIGE